MSKAPRHRVPGLPGSSFTRALAVACVALATAGTAAFAAAWTPAGIPFSTAPGDPSGLRAVSDGRGGFIAAWIDTIGGPNRIFCQRVDSTGVTRWTAGGVLVAVNDSAVTGLTAAPDGRDGILLAWAARRATSRSRVLVQRVDSLGLARWTANGLAPDSAAADTLQGSPGIDNDGAGGAIVAWVDGRNGTDDDVYVQRILADSSRAWTAGGVLLDVDGDPQRLPRVLGDGAGGTWVSWEDVEANPQTFFLRLDATGAVVSPWTAGGVTSSSSTSVNAVMARVPGTSNLMVAWSDPGPSRVEGTVLNASGSFVTPVGSLLLSSASAPTGIVAQAAGTALLVVAEATQVRATAINASGAATGSPVTLATGQALVASSSPRVVPDEAGGLYVVWASSGSAYAQHLSAAAVADWGATPVALSTAGSPAQTYPVAVPGFDLLAAWIDGRNAGTTGADLFAQRVSPSGVTGSYYRILALNAGGSGSFTPNNGRFWVREGDTLRVRYTGSGGRRVDSTVVGVTNLGPVPNYTFRNVTADSTLRAYFSNAPIVTQVAAPPSAYRAFSVPSTPAPGTIAALFANLMPYDPVRWRLGHWEADDSTYLEPGAGLASIVPGAGYWFIGLKDTTLSFSGTAVTEAQFNLPMLGGPVSARGWTQFGSPFRFTVAVSQLRLSLGADVPISDPGNTFTDPQVLEWNAGTQTYGAASTLRPGRAYWLWRQSAAAVTLRFPCEWNPVATGGTAPPVAAGADWSVGLTARSGEREARLAFGAAPVAACGWNRFSSHAPPAGPGEGLSLVARVSDWGDDNGAYTSVFRPDAETLAWEFDASAPAGLSQASLAFSFTNLPAGRRVVLSEPATGWSRVVEGGASVPLVLAANARRLRLEVLAGGPVTPPAPLATALRAAGPNPFRDATTLSFSLARGGPLRWDVYDLTGRRVASGARTLESGEHAVTWDGRDSGGRRVQPGLYLLRWQADGRSGTARLVRTD